MKRILKKRWAFLFALTALVAFAGIAWANYTDIYFDKVSGFILSDAAIGSKVLPGYEKASVNAVIVPPTTPNNGEVHIYYADGLITGVKKVSFDLEYVFKSGTAAGTAPNSWSVNAVGSSYVQPSTAFAVPVTVGAPGFKVGAFLTNDTTNGNIYIEDINNSPNSNSTKITLTKITTANASSGGSPGNRMNVGSWYGLVPGTTKLANLPSIDVRVSVNGGFKWVFDTINVGVSGDHTANGIKYNIKKPAVTTGYETYVDVEFTGKPLKYEDTYFYVIGDVVDAQNKVVLKDYAKLVKIGFNAGSTSWIIASNLISSTTDGNDRLTFVPNYGSQQAKSIILYFNGSNKLPKALTSNLNEHNLYDKYGVALFTSGVHTKDIGVATGLKVTRSVASDGSSVTYTFEGDPTSAFSDFDLYPGGLFDDNTNNGGYLLDPIRITTGTQTGAPALAARVITGSLSGTKANFPSTTEINIESSSGAVSINGVIDGTGALRSSPFTWNGLLITPDLTNNKVTVTRTSSGPDAEISQLFRVIGSVDWRSATDATFTISVDPEGVVSLTADPNPVRGTEKVTISNTVKFSAPGGATVVLDPNSIRPNSASSLTYRGVTFTLHPLSSDHVVVSGIPDEDGSFNVYVAGTAGQSSATGNFTVTIAAAVTPDSPSITLDQPTISDLVVGTYASKTVNVIQTPTTPALSGASFSSTSSGEAGTDTLTRTWNGLTLKIASGRITIAGTPENATTGTFPRGTFVISGTIDSKPVSTTLTISVNRTAATSDLLSSSTAWTLNPSTASRVATLNIPLTKTFVDTFGADGKVTTADIASVDPSIYSPYANLKKPVKFAIISGGTYGTLQLTLEFDTPIAGYEDDWYDPISISSVSFVGTNKKEAWANTGTVLLGDLQFADGGSSGGGCDAGFAGAALLLAGAFLAAGKARKR
ncbi:MAG: hypothetical protein LBL73_07805 [Synergistaceae bacterium]|jgi:hypothetical protein|nr:hypothetical protein [Synergistaceae bacterium]